MFSNILKIFLLTILAATPLAAQNSKNIKGKSFSGESRQTSVSGEHALLKGLFSYGTTVYQFQLPYTADRIRAGLIFRNLKNKWLKIYVYNYGTAYDDPALRNKKLAPNWRLWEATDGSDLWESRSPKYIYTTSYDGRIDYLGPQNICMILLYADGGIPFINDGRFLIEQISIEYDVIDNSVPNIVTSENAWIEGNFLLVKGIGKGRSRIDIPGYEVIPKKHALRAAQVDAQRNLAIALKKITPKGGTAFVPPSKIRSTRFIDELTAEVILEVPLAGLH